ncbi:C4-dicarboxylate TRAP transporter substrate-binding protein [Acuticoccus sp. I52.16.1]|uniref:C4-dicarboxylate TRAP transporter substrate-binding protein n=1 Tax=Acuticoccus sp. I52.16.1 TaxID=2928472 RepID=UPI001FD3D592|nr:C4-dicarboxylate TRAP transporter substrate-binding protein [Acuticoccus sp. I52.16.1]UOM35025.1 C4-dicarboxylate TRAP transporter substrate-binding protein [Acuticoccus sp. I52.16.1]
MKLATLSLAALLAATALGTAEAQTLRYASGFPPGGPVNEGLKDFVQYVEDNSDMSVKLYELSLLDLKETPPGIRDGVADMGYVLMPYFPAEYAEANLAADLSMLSTTGEKGAAPAVAMAGALTEYAMLHCEDCQAQFAQENQVYLGSASTPDYVLLCGQPVRDVADLKGKTFRSGASNFGRWAEEFGGTKVSIPGNEIYEAMSQGVVDCTMISAPELINLQLIDVTKAITVGVPGGVFAGSGAASMNKDTWTSLSDEQRAFMLKAAAHAVATITLKYNDAANEALDASREKGIEVIEPSAELLQASADFVKKDVDVIAEEFVSTYGLDGVAEKIETISGLVTKWKELGKGLDTDRDAFAETLWNEVYSKVDASTYGAM